MDVRHAGPDRGRRPWMRRAGVRLVAVATLALGIQGIAAERSPDEPVPSRRHAATMSAAGDLLPDLRVAWLYGYRFSTTAGGRTRLHFGTIGWNVGDGPLEARGRRIDDTDLVMRVWQRIYRADGTHRDRNAPAVMIYETGDHHDHWHTRQFMTVRLYEPGVQGGGVLGMRKIGYCLLDARRMEDPPPGSPGERGYPNGSCGGRDSQKLRTGLSIGYGDDYPPDYAHQWIDVTGLRTGVYRICTTVDPLGEFVELDETNNQRWTDVRINVATRRLTFIRTRVGRCGPSTP